MAKTATFWKNTMSVLSGTMVAQAIPLVGTLIMARIYTPADFGGFASWLAIVTVAAVALTARFESSLAVVADGEARETAFFATVTTAALLSVLATIVLALAVLCFPMVLGSMSAVQAVILIPAALAYALGQSWESFAAAEGAYRRLSILRIVQASIILLIQVGIGLFRPSAEALSLAFTFGAALTLILSSRLFPLHLPPHGMRRTMLTSFWKRQRRFPMFALPADTINTFSAQLPVLIVASRFGADYAGYLAMTIRLLGAPVTLLGRSVLDVFKRYASESYRERGHCRDEYLQTLRTLTIGAIVFCGVMLLVGQTAFALLLGEKWRMAGVIAIWMLPLYSLRFIASPLSYTFYIVDKQHVDLGWQIGLLGMTVATLTAFGSADLALKGYAYGYSALYLVYIYLSYRCSLGVRPVRAT
ncbi:oligosaccharide flippase family protein [Sphingomonas hankookensis]